MHGNTCTNCAMIQNIIIIFKNERSEQSLLTYEEQKARIARLNLMDDGFFQKIVQDPEISEEILRILLQMPKLKVISS